MGVFTKGLGYLFRDFSCWTSTHGIPHIGMANSQLLRFFWIFVVLASTAGCVWQLATIIAKYLAFNVNTETTLQFSERVFPTVTICHLNPWKNKAENGVNDMDIENLISAYGSPQTGYDVNFNYGFKAGLTAERQQRAVRWTTMMHEMIDNDGQLHAYTYEDLVVSCTYNAKTCNVTDFNVFEDANYGLCQTFNFDARYSSSRAGPLYGLRMVLRTDQSLYLPWTDASGMVVAIHGENDRAFPDVFGYFAPPGTASSLGVRFVSNVRMPAPYGDCSNEKFIESPYYNGSYEVEACFRACLQEHIVETCGCYDPAYATSDLSGLDSCYKLPTDQSSAEVTNNAISCIEQFTNPDGSAGSFNLINDCKCPQPCQTDTYSVTVSTAQWPSNAYKPSECNDELNGTMPWVKADNMSCIQWYKENTLLIEIYYERMNYQELKESAAYSMVNLVSDIGGQVGLFLGMSIISVIEFLTLLLLVICYCMTHRTRRQEIQELEGETAKATNKDNNNLSDFGDLNKENVDEGKKGVDNAVYDHKGDDQVVPPPVQDATR